MPSNPKTSKWYATPKSARKRKPLEIYLDPTTREALTRLALPGEAVSRTAERLIRKAAELDQLPDAQTEYKK